MMKRPVWFDELKAYLRKVLTVDVRSMALFRISLGFVLLADLLDRARFLKVFYTDDGVVPRFTILEYFQSNFQYSIHFISGDGFTQSILFAVNALFILCLIMGVKTRWVTFFCWFFYVSLNNRNPVVTFGGDVVIRNVLFWSMFMPLGLTYSVDAALSGKKYPKKVFICAGSVALMLQILFVYFFSGIHKHHPQWMSEGTALAYALELDQFATSLGIWMRQFPFVLKIMTHATFGLELFGPIVMLLPFARNQIRMLGVLSYWSLHIGIFLFMNIGLFPWMCIAVWTIFLPSSFWDFFKKHFKSQQGKGLTIYFDRDCGFCKKGVYILQELLGIRKAKIAPAQSHVDIEELMRLENSWVVQNEKGKRWTRYTAFIKLVEDSFLSRILLPFVKFKPVRILGERIYRLISYNRQHVSFLTRFIGFKDQTYQSKKWTPLVVAFLLAYVFMYNLGTIEWRSPIFKKYLHEPYALTPMRRVLRLDQDWSMFAPKPTSGDGWFVMHGKTLAGEDVNLWNTDYTRPYVQPENVSKTFVSHRWRKYLRNLRQKKNVEYRRQLGRYLCRVTNRKRNRDDRLDVLKINYMLHRTSLGEPNPVLQENLWRHYCFSEPSEVNMHFASFD